MIRLVPLLALLGACAAHQATPQPVLVGGGTATCDVAGLTDLVGKPGTSPLAAEALKRSGASRLRWLQPGTAVTMDYRRDRLDIHLSAENIVTRLTCG